MFLFADLSVEEYVSQMTTATIIAAILGVIGVGLLIFAFIRKHQKTLAQSAATDTVDKPEEEKAQTEQQPQKKSFQFKDWTDNAQTEEIPDAQDAQTVDQPDEEQSLATESAATEETTEPVEEETPAEESETLPVEEEPAPEEPATEETPVEEEEVTPQEEPTEEIPEETAEETAEDIAAEEIVAQPQVAPEQPQQPADTAEFVFGNSKRKSIPFETKVAEGNEMTIEAYETISKYLLSLPNVKQAKAFACERYYIGRKSVAKLTIRGKTINCYLAVDPATLDAKYHAQDASGSQKYEKTPAMIKARSPRAIKYCCTLAKNIVDEINNGNN